MSEFGKTSVYVVIALVLTGAAYLSRPTQEVVGVGDMVDKPVFSDFDPNKVQGLRVVRYEEDLGEIHSFEVAKNPRTGLWTIPSHSDYPADAEERVRDAATLFLGLKVLGVVTEDAREHALFGVLEPDKDKVKLGDKGVGLLVRFEGEKGRTQALIIGKGIKGAEGHRFVRIPGQDPVYDVQVDPAKLSTKFEDWIKKDLLELNTWDIENLRIKDYSIVEARDGTFLEPRFEVAVSWNTTDNKWRLDEFFNYKGREKTSATLTENEELNKQKLDELKTALDDLSIVDVRRKPKGLGANLRAGDEFMKDMESRNSLRSRGFYPNPAGDSQFEVLAANGEVHVSMKDGVQYVLRFGNVAESSDAAKEGKLNRYLLVTAKVDDSKLPIPTPPAGLDPAKAAEVQAAAENAAQQPAETPAAQPESQPEATPVPDATAPDATSPPADATPAAPAPAAPEEQSEEQSAPAPAGPAATEGSAASLEAFVPVARLADAEEQPAEATPAEAAPAAEASAEPASAEPQTAEPPASETAPAPESAPAPEAAPMPEAAAEAPAPPAPPTGVIEAAAPDAEAAPAAESSVEMPAPPAEPDRERLAKDYQRQLDDWNEKKKKADIKVRELNSRFADWYYVISEDVYKKIHLSRTDLVRETEAAKESGIGIDAFRGLEQQGVEKKKSDGEAKDDQPGFGPGSFDMP